MIGIFDSGSGGLSVLRELRKRAPTADIIYFGDLKNAPYGNKSREELGALTVLGIQKLIDEGATEIVSACNSVSVSIVLPMFDILDIPRVSIIEMVGPTVASFRTTEASLLVAATKATVDSGVYQNGLRMVGVRADGVAVPELVALIESGAGEKAVQEEIRKALQSFSGSSYTHVLLGCTHYPLVEDVFTQVLQELGFDAVVFNPALPVAQTVAERFNIQGVGSTRFIVSAEHPAFREYLEHALPNEKYTIDVV